MKKFFEKKWVKRVTAVVAVILIVAAALLAWKIFGPKEQPAMVEVTAIVTRRNITNSVTGSASVEAYETYDVVSTVSGEILECNAEVGDWVEKDQVLYKFDTESGENRVKDAQNSVEDALLNLESAREAVDNLTIKAPVSGLVTDLSLKLKADASGKACTITDNTYMSVIVPVSATDVANISIGDEVTVGIEKYMMTKTGKVEDIMTGTFSDAAGANLQNVEIRIENPGSITEGTMASATIHTVNGDVEGAEAAALSYPAGVDVKIEQSGEVKALYVKNTDWVNAGDVIAVLENDDVHTRLRSAEITYEKRLSELSDAKKELGEYIITSPIAGEVLAKQDYKEGEKVTAGQNGGTTLMTVADTRKLKFTINVDELDVSKISAGQNVSITSQAITGARFAGVIENVSKVGTASNGVTIYPVVVRIDNPPEGLYVGMNVNAEIVVESVQNAIAVPASAVSYYDGAYYVTVIGEAVGVEDTGVATGGNMPRGNMPQGGMPRGEMPTGEMPTGDMPRGEMTTGDMSRGNMPSGGANRGGTQGGGRTSAGGQNTQQEEIEQKLYAEPMQVQVTTGISDDDYIEIKSGLKVGQIVSYTISTQGNNPMGMGGMRGGMPQGGMGGGMSQGGRMPQGGMSGRTR